MQFEIHEQQGIQILKLNLEYLNSSTAASFKSEAPIDQLSTEKILLDLSHLQFVDSTGLGAIIGLNKRLLEKGQCLALISANQQIKSVFELVKMHKIISLFNNFDDAIAQSWT